MFWTMIRSFIFITEVWATGFTVKMSELFPTWFFSKFWVPSYPFRNATKNSLVISFVFLLRCLMIPGLSSFICQFWKCFMNACHKTYFSWWKHTVFPTVETFLQLTSIKSFSFCVKLNLFVFWSIFQSYPAPFELIYVSCQEASVSPSFLRLFIIFLQLFESIHLIMTSKFYPWPWGSNYEQATSIHLFFSNFYELSCDKASVFNRIAISLILTCSSFRCLS